MSETPWSNPDHDIIRDLREAWKEAQVRIRALVRPESVQDLRAKLDALGFATRVEVQASEFVSEGQAIVVRLCRHGQPNMTCFECAPRITWRAGDFPIPLDLAPPFPPFRITDMT